MLYRFKGAKKDIGYLSSIIKGAWKKEVSGIASSLKT